MLFDINLNPALSELILPPGQTYTQSYTLTNNSTTDLPLELTLEPFTSGSSDGSPNYLSVPTNPALSFAYPKAILLKAHQTAQVSLKITASSEFSGDSYYTLFFSQPLTDTSLPQARAKVGSHLLLTTATTAPKAEISRFQASPHFFKDIFLTPLTFTARVDNPTSNFFKTAGTITLSKGSTTLRTLTLLPQNVLSQGSRDLKCVTDQGTVSACRLNPPFWPGFYTATLTLDESISAPATSISFFILPYSIFIPLLLATFIAIILSRVRRKH